MAEMVLFPHLVTMKEYVGEDGQVKEYVSNVAQVMIHCKKAGHLVYRLPKGLVEVLQTRLTNINKAIDEKKVNPFKSSTDRKMHYLKIRKELLEEDLRAVIIAQFQVRLFLDSFDDKAPDLEELIKPCEIKKITR